MNNEEIYAAFKEFPEPPKPQKLWMSKDSWDSLPSSDGIIDPIGQLSSITVKIDDLLPYGYVETDEQRKERLCQPTDK